MPRWLMKCALSFPSTRRQLSSFFNIKLQTELTFIKRSFILLWLLFSGVISSFFFGVIDFGDIWPRQKFFNKNVLFSFLAVFTWWLPIKVRIEENDKLWTNNRQTTPTDTSLLSDALQTPARLPTIHRCTFWRWLWRSLSETLHRRCVSCNFLSFLETKNWFFNNF